jgi:Domain of unknown function (DUF4037)
LRAAGTADPDVLGVVLTGSRALGVITDESDYDAAFIVTDSAMARYTQHGREPSRQHAVDPSLATADLWHQAASSLRAEQLQAWEYQMWADARVIYDRTGAITTALQAIQRIPAEQAPAIIERSYDAYLNALYRSLKSWRRGNDLGGRLEAAESITYLLSMLFALERRWRPFSSRLWLHLDNLDGQGWQPDELGALLLELLAAGDPRRQQTLAHRVVTLLATRGYGAVYDSWEGQIDQALAWEFA